MNQPSLRRILPRDCVEAYDTPGRGGNNWSRNRAREFGADTDEQAEEYLADHGESLEEREARIEAHARYYGAALRAVPDISSNTRADEEEWILTELTRDWEGTTRTLRRVGWL
jgi:hypothetical protein